MKLRHVTRSMSVKCLTSSLRLRVKKGGEWIEGSAMETRGRGGTRRVYVWFSLDCMPSPGAEEKMGHRPVGAWQVP